MDSTVILDLSGNDQNRDSQKKLFNDNEWHKLNNLFKKKKLGSNQQRNPRKAEKSRGSW